MRARAGFASIMLAVVVAGCTSRNSPENVADVRKTLDSSLALHAEHFKQANVAGLAEGYGTNAVVRPAGMEPIRGREAIRNTLGAWIAAAPITALSYTNEDLAVFGDTAFQIVTYDSKAKPPGGAEVSDRGNCALLWVRDAQREWRVERSLCNSMTPPQQQVNRTGRTGK